MIIGIIGMSFVVVSYSFLKACMIVYCPAPSVENGPTARYVLSNCVSSFIVRSTKNPVSRPDYHNIVIIVVSCPGQFNMAGTDYISSKVRSEEHTSELQSRPHIVCRLLLE